jgi:predicted dehydrogenase
MDERLVEQNEGLSRRQFVKTSLAVGAGVMLAADATANTVVATPAQGARKRYALVGTGGRSYMYHQAVTKDYAQYAELVGLCDLNEGRVRIAQEKAKKITGKTVPIYLAADFDKMIAETKPDTVIVTTKDGVHHQYIIRAMELGCDAITEKPMTIDEKKCAHILKTQRNTGRKCTVTFNYRYSPPRTQVKDMLINGVIGDILSVDFHWMLDTLHGADYFRRWHSDKANSGGLMIHKATHHFDLVNWWLSDVPEEVFATGKREFYTPKTAQRLGLSGAHERCLTCPEKAKCTFFMDLAADSGLKELYLDCEQYGDHYQRDKCIWRKDINIEDTMNVLVKYRRNTTLCYSLNAFNGWEGYHVVFNGTKGRLEHKNEERTFIDKDGTVPGGIGAEEKYIRVYPLRAPAYQVKMWSGEGGHGGGDTRMLDDLFLPEKKTDKYLTAADQRSGAYSILIGAAANICFKKGKPVRIHDLVKDIGMPDYPPMPTHEDPLPMPPKV